MRLDSAFGEVQSQKHFNKNWQTEQEVYMANMESLPLARLTPGTQHDVWSWSQPPVGLDWVT